MTLVAALKVEDIPVLVGDILLSTPSGGAIGHVPTLTEGDLVRLTPPGYTVAGVRRKVVVLGDGVVIGWAGTEIAARAVVRDLRALCAGSEASVERVGAFLRGYPDLGSGVTCELVGWLVDRDGPVAFKWNSVSREFRWGEARYVAGSGAEDFARETLSPRGTYSTPDMAPSEAATRSALDLVGTILGKEILSGRTLQHLYGGGAEVAILADGRFRVVDNTAFLFWMVDVDVERRRIRMGLNTVMMKYMYVEDCLVVRTTRLNEQGEPLSHEVYVVLPVDMAESECRVERFLPRMKSARYFNLLLAPLGTRAEIRMSLVLGEPNRVLGFSEHEGEEVTERLWFRQDLHTAVFQLLAPNVQAVREFLERNV